MPTKNAFESGAQKVIPAVLVYAKCGDEILMLHRVGEKHLAGQDIHGGKWNGLGGKFEPGETPIQCARREFFEEAGVDANEKDFTPLGILQFPNFRAVKSEDWMVYVFTLRIDRDHLGLQKKCPEGELSWVKVDQIKNLNMWEGDRIFIPFVIQDRPFMGSLQYVDGRLTSHWIQALG